MARKVYILFLSGHWLSIVAETGKRVNMDSSCQQHCGNEPYKHLPPIEDLDKLVQKLHEAFATDKVDVDYVKALMESYTTNPDDWQKFAMFDDYR